LERWPSADVLVEYLEDYAIPQQTAGRIRYNTTVLSVKRVGVGSGAAHAASSNPARFEVATTFTAGSSGRPYQAGGGDSVGEGSSERAKDASSTVTRCRAVVVATGLAVANRPASVLGIELATGYEDLPATGESFEGKAVLVLGAGNAGLETANALAPHVAYVHVVPGRESQVHSHAVSKRSGPGAEGEGNCDTDTDPHRLLSWESRWVTLVNKFTPYAAVPRQVASFS
jgi:hypothetical protein